MKPNVTRGGGFRGALNYAFDVGEKSTGIKFPEPMGGTMSALDPRNLAAEFAHTRRLRRDIKRPVFHCSLALPAGERISAFKWEEIAADFLKKLGFPPDTQWVAIRHNDTDHDHIHIIASRISLSGEVWHGKWEAFKAIEAAQELEKEHGLTITQGLYDHQLDEKRLKKGEIEMALATGKEPVRQRLQALVKAASEDEPTVIQFVERLNLVGVNVRPNLASTGKLNGFSFELDGIAFKASQLGKAYSWPSLEKSGVTYEQARDCEKLKQFVSTARNFESDQELGRGSETVAGSDIERDMGSPGELLSGHRDSAEDAGRADDLSATAVEREASTDRSSNEPVAESAEGIESEDKSTRSNSTEIDREQSEINSERAESEVALVDQNDQLSSSSNDRGNAGSCWSLHFRRASAAKKRAINEAKRGNDGSNLEQRKSSRARVSEVDVSSSRSIDPTQYLVSVGFNVKREGRHLSVYQGKDEVYRISQKPDGHWVSCDHYGNGVGDNIALVQDIEHGTSFPDAIYKLTGSMAVDSLKYKTIDSKNNRNVDSQNNYMSTRQPPKLPIQLPEHKDAGRGYLLDRGVSIESIEAAEKCGMLRYCGGGVVFTGTDSAGVVQNATKRAVDPANEVQKRDFKGSDKQYPPILPGSKDVWIVEGGVDALALRDLYIRAEQEPPTVIVTGGANVLSWIDNKDLQPLLKDARIVVVAKENEKDDDAKQRADAGHAKQIAALEELGCNVRYWQTPEGYKDLADYNEQRGDVEQRRQLEKERRLAARSQDQDRDQEPEMGM